MCLAANAFNAAKAELSCFVYINIVSRSPPPLTSCLFSLQVKPEPQDAAAPMDTAPYGSAPPDPTGVKAEPPIYPTGDPAADQPSLTAPIATASQEPSTAMGEGAANFEPSGPMGVSAVPSQDSLMPEVSLQVLCVHKGKAVNKHSLWVSSLCFPWPLVFFLCSPLLIMFFLLLLLPCLCLPSAFFHMT